MRVHKSMTSLCQNFFRQMACVVENDRYNDHLVHSAKRENKIKFLPVLGRTLN